MAANDLTAARLRELLDYDPLTGLFKWRNDAGRWGRIKAGTLVGSPDTNGHLRVNIGGRYHYMHRLAFLYMTGEWPSQKVDHRDGEPSNNVFDNLRDVTQRVNTENRRAPVANKASGLPLGVSCDKRDGAIRADITVAGKCISLGRHATADLAHAAYLEAKRRLHAGCTL